LLWSDDTTNHIVSLYVLTYFALKIASIAAETFWWQKCR